MYVYVKKGLKGSLSKIIFYWCGIKSEPDLGSALTNCRFTCEEICDLVKQL